MGKVLLRPQDLFKGGANQFELPRWDVEACERRTHYFKSDCWIFGLLVRLRIVFPPAKETRRLGAKRDLTPVVGSSPLRTVVWGTRSQKVKRDVETSEGCSLRLSVVDSNEAG